jgi:hypothetical protein
LGKHPAGLGIFFQSNLWVTFAYLAIIPSLEARIFTSSNGTAVDGEVFEVDGHRVGLRINDRDYYFLISRFVREDQTYIQKWSAVKRCSSCKVKVGAGFREAGDDKYHAQCFRCLACRKSFAGGDGLGKGPWGGLVHLEHTSQVSSCDSCSRFFRREDSVPKQYFGDGRVHCGVCLEDGVFEGSKVTQVQARILPVLKGVGMGLPNKPIQVELVDRSFLAREAKRIKAEGKLRGLTLTKFRITRGSPSSVSFDHRIYILSGLPYVECISVLAHEYAHVWLNERFIDSTPPEIEGFCNLISEICLGQDKSKMSLLLRENMIKSENPVYGAGFRRMRSKLKSLGWDGLFAEMLSKSSPPR